MILSGLFGNETAAKALLFLQAHETGYARAISLSFDISISQVQRQLERLELEGVLSSKLLGKTRLYSFNPRCFYIPELRSILVKAISMLPPEVSDSFVKTRTRPRRKGKALP